MQPNDGEVGPEVEVVDNEQMLAAKKKNKTARKLEFKKKLLYLFIRFTFGSNNFKKSSKIHFFQFFLN